MNSFQEALSPALSADSESLEIIGREKNKVTAIYNGIVYHNYSELPRRARFSIARALSPLLREYTYFEKKYGSLEAEERMVWCLFGSMDCKPDFNISKGKYNIEVSSHCTFCQYIKPFCKRVLPNLTPRQQECYTLMRRGMTDKEIANNLGISYYTVLRHMNNAVERVRDSTGINATRQTIINDLNYAGI
jgi:hypothetical protein